jgi:DNA-binding NtrC family response regulator
MVSTLPGLSVLKSFSCLVVEDDAGFADMLSQVVLEEGGEPSVCYSIAAARARIAQRAFDLTILDNLLPDGSGFDFYHQLIRRWPSCLVAMITGAPELSQAVELTRNGLFEYLAKPVSALAFATLLRRAQVRLGQPESDTSADVLLGSSPLMDDVRLLLEQAARHVTATVLLLGETGTGKELAARYLHRLTFAGRSPKAPFIAVNCSNIPAEMFEAELFGNTKGAFTGASHRRTGLAEAAEGGTLFLDEVVEIPAALQAKLLRFLESGEYRPLGATGTNQFHGRVVAATNRSLADEVRAGRFRDDLWYRLDVFSVHLPPLREHINDLDSIAASLLQRLCEKYRRPAPLLRPQDMNALRGHSFPGNVRELRNVLERSLLRTDSAAQCLNMDLAWLRGTEPSSSGQWPTLTAAAATAILQLTPVERQEYQLIATTLREENGGIRRAAARLGLTHQALLRRLQKWPELRQISSSIK